MKIGETADTTIVLRIKEINAYSALKEYTQIT
jgi:hypothetical protein